MAQINQWIKVQIQSSNHPVYGMLHRADENGIDIWEDEIGPARIEWGNILKIEVQQMGPEEDADEEED